MKPSLKKIFESDNWIITKIHNGLNSYRVDAKRRFHVPDESDFFSKWASIDYINRLAMKYYGKKANKFNSFRY